MSASTCVAAGAPATGEAATGEFPEGPAPVPFVEPLFLTVEVDVTSVIPGRIALHVTDAAHDDGPSAPVHCVVWPEHFSVDGHVL